MISLQTVLREPSDPKARWLRRGVGLMVSLALIALPSIASARNWAGHDDEPMGIGTAATPTLDGETAIGVNGEGDAPIQEPSSNVWTASFGGSGTPPDGGDAPGDGMSGPGAPTGGSDDEFVPPEVSGPDEDVRVAVLSSMIATFRFGATVGTPVACSTSVSTVGLQLTQFPELAGALTPYLNEILVTCAEFAAGSDEALAQFNEAIAPLAAANEVLNPGIQAFADAVRSTGEAIDDSADPGAQLLIAVADILEFYKG